MDFNSIINQLSNGPQGQDPNNQQAAYDNWNQMVGSAPPEQVGQAATSAITQISPQEYQQHVTPGMGGTDPLGQLPQSQLSGIASTVLGMLTSHGVGLNNAARSAGVSTMDPSSMSPSDLSSLLQWTQQNHPQVLGQVATQYQNQPNILQAILGNPALLSMLTSLGSQFLSNRSQQGGGGISRSL